ncbi:unnamed protein product [Ambrosiozyma monospora]|uniref:Unnamed protein product n=1 Tax=Ambrosiozyma monospora TaxID=43982 RepID=A0ACB5U163_AMBMO|nr:unnamed protein product [Ambrosiozyma monospora]
MNVAQCSASVLVYSVVSDDVVDDAKIEIGFEEELLTESVPAEIDATLVPEPERPIKSSWVGKRKNFDLDPPTSPEIEGRGPSWPSPDPIN